VRGLLFPCRRTLWPYEGELHWRRSTVSPVQSLGVMSDTSQTASTQSHTFQITCTNPIVLLTLVNIHSLLFTMNFLISSPNNNNSQKGHCRCALIGMNGRA
jgi:hypothetical protein